MAQAPHEECETQNQQRVGQDRPDERGPDDVEQAGPQREDADEQLRQITEGRLDHARGPWPETMGQLFRALSHQHCEPGQPDRRRAERGYRGGSAKAQEQRGHARAHGHENDDPGSGLEVPQHSSASWVDCAGGGAGSRGCDALHAHRHDPAGGLVGGPGHGRPISVGPGHRSVPEKCFDPPGSCVEFVLVEQRLELLSQA